MSAALDILTRYWGYTSFRPMQEEIIDSVLSGHDTLGLLPTGAGKSVTFQVPGIALGGVTLVVTPLIALMKDQVDNLNERGIKAAFLHSGMTYGQVSDVWRALAYGNCRFLYVAPERLLNERFLAEIRDLKKVTLVVADEAHCISQWGYDFRPAYLSIASLRKILPPSVPFLALTASATPKVANDICNILQFKNKAVFRTSFARPNISYVVRPTETKEAQIVHIMRCVPGTAIVYVRNRKLTSALATMISRAGINALPFHAGMEYELKEERINLWKQGKCRVMVSTNAFGMGIDKPDVRLVIHYDLPPSLEEYYQEAGRAGRDGKPSYAVLLLDSKAPSRMKRHFTESFPSLDTIARIYERICNFLGIALEEGYGRIFEFDIDVFCSTFKMQRAQVEHALCILGAAGYMTYIDERESASRVMITNTREELYSVCDYSGKTDSILRALLRNCPGIFADYVYFNENKIAQEAECSRQEVYDTLLSLNRERVLKYIPRKRTAFIHLPTSREESQQIQIPRSVYEIRKKIISDRIQAVLKFALDQYGCRADTILRYFGEKDTAPCNSCDLCRQAGKPLEAERLRDIRLKICELLCDSPEGLSADSVARRFRPHGRVAIDVLSRLADAGVISQRGQIYQIENES